ncbi:tRNA pseudouridine synthase A [Vulcanimicrobium alpinum]|uniref:tRNA pseudouridine synthase A n=1 Tax=Vulcanimicrobium alpinum TaxID=3016050 RepID=A0AAN2CBC6_UNVUL|nr:tRNA pseudouridine(38-40) synthase TruA [Vulcanimicrobium alpinum]BDE07602.1 tRNA pseudouridine synthase A [Vulcanimicrobium alpinum]
MPTYRLVVEYDGSAFHGLQYQPALRTVAGALEDALARLFHQVVKISAAGRTDAGVHATGQVISFRAERAFPIERLRLALNACTPADLVVRDAALVADGFSARFDALERVYDYLIVNRPYPSAIWRARAWIVPRALDDARLVQAAAPLVGEHDFVTFCGELPERGGTVREVFAIDAARSGDLVRITVRGNAFLHRMVRIIVGTLVDVATGYRDLELTARALAARDRTAAGTTAPAHGLYLAGVRYDAFDTYRPVALRP